MRDGVSRRELIGTAAVGAGALWLSGQARAQAATTESARSAMPPVKIYKIYVGKKRAAWPKPAFEPATEIPKFDKVLTEVEKKLGDVQFIGGELVSTPEQVDALAGKLKDADGILLIQLTLGILPAMQRLVDAGRPTIVFSQPFSGHEWMFVEQWMKAGKRVALMPTSDLGELADAAALLRVPARMARSRLILVGDPAGTPTACAAEQVKQRLGVEVVQIGVDRVIEAHRAVDPAMAEQEADRFWLGQARKIVEPSRDEVIKSARMFFAMKSLMDAERAQAITIKCLGGIPIDVLGYPCLGFSKLLDLGLVGACEADMDSTLTMLMFTYAFGSPGFITDPFFDTARNAVVHAHCTAPTRMDGPAGQRAPFIIRTHTDDDKGAALAVELRVGQIITCAKLVNLDTMILSTGKITEIPDFDDRGCRTQIVTEVANARKLLDNWGGGMVDGWVPQLHRVVFYGDRTRGVKHLSTLMGFKVFEGM